MKVYDTWNEGKQVEKTEKQFEVANKLYPNRFVDKKPKSDLPELKETKKPKAE